LAGILAIAHAKAPPAGGDGVVSQAKPAEGPPGQHNWLKHKGRPDGTADVAEIAQQVKLVAGVGFEPTTFRL
jgi:hypothetical protein